MRRLVRLSRAVFRPQATRTFVMTKTRSKAIRKPRLLITTQDHAILISMIGSAPCSAAAMLLEDEHDHYRHSEITPDVSGLAFVAKTKSRRMKLLRLRVACK